MKTILITNANIVDSKSNVTLYYHCSSTMSNPQDNKLDYNLKFKY